MNDLIALLNDFEIPVSNDGSIDITYFDSILFVTFIIEIEKLFSINIPDDFLLIDYFSTVDKIADIIRCLGNNK